MGHVSPARASAKTLHWTRGLSHCHN